MVKKDPLSKVAGESTYRINNKNDEKYGHRPRDEIVRDAEAMVGKQMDYHLFNGNCEHFATKLRNGVSISGQVCRKPSSCVCHNRMLHNALADPTAEFRESQSSETLKSIKVH